MASAPELGQTNGRCPAEHRRCGFLRGGCIGFRGGERLEAGENLVLWTLLQVMLPLLCEIIIGALVVGPFLLCGEQHQALWTRGDPILRGLTARHHQRLGCG